MNQNNVIKFYRVGDDFGSFSNFSKHPIFVDGIYWPTSEHYFQAQKFEKIEDFLEIQGAATPMEAANLGRDRTKKIRKDWDDLKDDVMRKAVLAKTLQNADVRELLLSTRESKIIEHTINDNYWADGGDGTGKNMLGTILMEIRDQLTKDGPYDELKNLKLPPWIKHPELDRFSLGWRMGYGEGYMNEWAPWFGGLSKSGQQYYINKFPEPDDWTGFYDDDTN